MKKTDYLFFQLKEFEEKIQIIMTLQKDCLFNIDNTKFQINNQEIKEHINKIIKEIEFCKEQTMIKADNL